MGLPLTVALPLAINIADVASAVAIETGNETIKIQARHLTQDSRTCSSTDGHLANRKLVGGGASTLQ
jgi:hypothetical protein